MALATGVQGKGCTAQQTKAEHTKEGKEAKTMTNDRKKTNLDSTEKMLAELKKLKEENERLELEARGKAERERDDRERKEVGLPLLPRPSASPVASQTKVVQGGKVLVSTKPGKTQQTGSVRTVYLRPSFAPAAGGVPATATEVKGESRKATPVKAEKTPAAPKTAKEPPFCGCGCGEKTKGGKYRPGHDAKHHAALKAAGKAVTLLSGAVRTAQSKAKALVATALWKNCQQVA